MRDVRVYIAGPMKDMPELNYPAFEEARAKLLACGYGVESPTDNDDGTAKHYTEYLKLGLIQLLRCDGVALLPGWERSGGARMEAMVGATCGLEVRSLAEWLLDVG